MLDRLYCPDFSSVFGEKFRSPYKFPMIDSLVWPLFTDLEPDPKVNNLLSLKYHEGNHAAFYRRKITLKHLITELRASGIQGICLQAFEFGKDVEYGIPSEYVLKIAEKYSWIFPIISPLPNEEGFNLLKKVADRISAVVFYPSYQNIDLANPSKEFLRIIDFCFTHRIPVKIDLGNMYLPHNNQENCTPAKLRAFISKHWENTFVISGIDILGNGKEIINILRYERNAYLELDPRTFGGMTPESFFRSLFEIPGFVQNYWSRIILGSSTPTLESSQITRGWWAATEDLPFAQRNLLRTWMYRTIHRVYPLPGLELIPYGDSFGMDCVPLYQLRPAEVVKKGENELFIHQDIIINSTGITQLIDISIDALKEALKILETYSDYKYGELSLRTYHTTTSLIINEHEIGNYLQLHYLLVEHTMENAEDKLHTVAALENRADFNFPDHILASLVGDKDLTIPIVNGRLLLGGREHIYVLITFGPREIRLSLTFKLFKGENRS